MIINPYRYAAAGGGYQTETTLWETRGNALGGSVTTTEKNYADALVVAIKAASYASKIRYLLPFIGAGIAFHRVPLIDVLNVGAASLYGGTPLTDANCDTSTGLVNSTEQSGGLNTLIQAQSLHPSDSTSGGMGFWERNWGAGTGVEPIGCYDASGSDRFVIDLRSTLQRFRWGNATGTQAGPGTTAGSKHYYGQVVGSTNTTEIYADGSSLGSNGTSNQAGPSENIFVMGCNQPTDTFWKGRCAVAYLTDGTMSSGDVSAFHTLLNTYLISATGR